MFIPVGLDEDEVRRAPWISYGITGVNVAVFLATWIGGGDPGRFGRFVSSDPRLAATLTSTSRAIALYDRVVGSDPNDPAALRALLQAAHLRARSGATDRARQDLESARRHPSCTGEWQAAVDRKAAELEALPTRSGFRPSSPLR